MLRNWNRLFLIMIGIVVGVHQSSFAQTVQLPSFSRFTYSGSVLVPTQGSTALGGISRSASGRSRRGLSGRALGVANRHAAARAHVTIIDNDAIDRQIRGLPPRDSQTGQAFAGSSNLSRPAQSTKALAGNRIAKPVSDPDSEGKALVRFARKQYLAGHRASAFDAYRIAIETLSPKLSELAMAEFQRVFPTKKRPLSWHQNRFAGPAPIQQP